MPQKNRRTPLIPPPEIVRARLLDVCREARLLRRLLRVARDAGLPLTTADRLPVPADQEGVRHDG